MLAKNDSFVVASPKSPGDFLPKASSPAVGGAFNPVDFMGRLQSNSVARNVGASYVLLEVS